MKQPRQNTNHLVGTHSTWSTELHGDRIVVQLNNDELTPREMSYLPLRHMHELLTGGTHLVSMTDASVGTELDNLNPDHHRAMVQASLKTHGRAQPNNHDWQADLNITSIHGSVEPDAMDRLVKGKLMDKRWGANALIQVEHVLTIHDFARYAMPAMVIVWDTITTKQPERHPQGLLA